MLFNQQNSTAQRKKSTEKWNDLTGVSLICQGTKMNMQASLTPGPVLYTVNIVTYNLQMSIFTFYEFIVGHASTHKFICLLISVPSKALSGASLVMQWLRIRLPMQGTRGVRALVREDPTCRGATKPMRHNY